MRLDDDSFREPPSSEVSHAPMWSPDGARVVYDDVQGLRIQSLDGQVSYLITHDARDATPVWSPDGDSVAFVRRQHDHWEIYAVDADGRNQRRLTDTPRKPNGKVGSSAAPASAAFVFHSGHPCAIIQATESYRTIDRRCFDA